MRADADGVCMNVGGDLRVDGDSPGGRRLDRRPRAPDHGGQRRARPSAHGRGRVDLAHEARLGSRRRSTPPPRRPHDRHVGAVGLAGTAVITGARVVGGGARQGRVRRRPRRGRSVLAQHGASGYLSTTTAWSTRPARPRRSPRDGDEEHARWASTSPGTCPGRPGIVTWGLLVASMLWGFLYATRAPRAAGASVVDARACTASSARSPSCSWSCTCSRSSPTTTRPSASPTSSCRSRPSGARSRSRSASSGSTS